MKKLTLVILLVGAGCETSSHQENPSVCGDSVVNAQEECDDGNNIADDGCTDCLYDAVCGNDKTEDPPEECDDGNTAGGDGCSSTCQHEVSLTCGNAVVDEGEECDSDAPDDCSIYGQVGPLSCDGDCFYDTTACIDDPACAGTQAAICAAPTTQASTTDVLDTYDCVTGVDTAGPEAIYEWTAPSDGASIANLSLTPPFSTTLVVLDTGVPPACLSVCLGSGTMIGADTIQYMFAAEAGHRYVLIVDTPDAGSIMTHSLYISCPMP